MRIFFKILIIFTMIFCVACKSKPAKIVNRSHIFYGKDNVLNKDKYSGKTFVKDNEDSSSFVNSDQKIVVQEGETLYAIARKHNVSLRDLIEANNLSAPYNLQKGDRLQIPTPRYHEVKNGDTLYSISRLYNTKLNHLIELNNLKEPYQVKAGEKLRINNFENKKPNISYAQKTPSKPKETKSDGGFFSGNLSKNNKFSWPIKGPVISKFGPKTGGLYNDGINILAKDGSEVKSAEDGVVAYVGNELKGYGNLVIVKHSGGWITAYAHLKDSLVKRGQKINQGDKIGYVGASGNVSSPQLYFGLRKGRDAVNPVNYLRG